MEEFWNAFEDPKLNMEQLFKNLKDSLGERYKEFSFRQSTLMKEIGAVNIDKSKILETTKELGNIFSKRCRIRNRSDIELLCEAVCRMYKTNRWCGVSTTDYGDMVRNASQIERLTSLAVCDRLYVLYRLDSKLDVALQPKSAAAKFKIHITEFLKSTKPVGVV